MPGKEQLRQRQVFIGDKQMGARKAKKDPSQKKCLIHT